MRILITGASGFVGRALIARLQRDGHTLRALGRDGERLRGALAASAIDGGVELALGDVLSGEGLARAVDGIEVAYYLIHSMEPSPDGAFAERERSGAENFARAAADAGVGRIVYLGGLLPSDSPSPHLASRHAVEDTLLAAVPGSVALRASIVIAARSRSFRFMVRLVERLPVMALPAWRDRRTAPIDGRDVMELLVAAASASGVDGRSLDIAGPEVLTYEALLARIAACLGVLRPTLALRISATPLAAPLAAAVSGERIELIRPLMESLESDLLARDREGERILGVRLHSLDAALARALRDWEAIEPLRAR